MLNIDSNISKSLCQPPLLCFSVTVPAAHLPVLPAGDLKIFSQELAFPTNCTYTFNNKLIHYSDLGMSLQMGYISI